MFCVLKVYFGASIAIYWITTFLQLHSFPIWLFVVVVVAAVTEAVVVVCGKYNYLSYGYG